MVWGQLLGAAVGGLFANNAAKKQAKAIDAANAANNMGYTDARPYFTDLYSRGQDALDAKLAAGPYQGPLYAGLNDMQRNVLGRQYNFGNNALGGASNIMGSTGGFANNYSDLYNSATASNLNNTASDLYNSASNNNMYAGNARDIYNRATGGFFNNEARDLYNKAGQSGLGAAQDYALNNSQGLVDAAMRGANRQLNEVALPNLNNQASGSGNTNSSRAGVAEAILRRGNAELEADTTSRINDQLMGRALSSNNQDFQNQLGALSGMKSGRQAQLNAMSGALGDMRFGDQARFNNMMSGFNAMNTANNNTFNNAMNANAGMATAYNNAFGMGNTALGNMLGVGGAYQKDLQNQYDAAKNQYNTNLNFGLDTLADYRNGILSGAPRTPAQQQANLVDPTAAAMSGAMSGWGFGGKYIQPYMNQLAGFA